ncbi:MAG: VacJ family lipoprotein [Deltaproteobacteria bacterium]|nr:VacJ family lipoprotein [Deltaproteobacteria bacterium]
MLCATVRFRYRVSCLCLLFGVVFMVIPAWAGSLQHTDRPSPLYGTEGILLKVSVAPFTFAMHGEKAGEEEGAEAPIILSQAPKDPFADDFDDDFEDDQPGDIVSDPMQPMNRKFFTFNDRLYFWFFKPVGTGYKALVPEPIRVSIRNFFSNFRMPIRALNCLLQGKMKGAGIEISRFAINSTLGVFGLGDAAKKVFNLDAYEEDFGQTLGFHGVPPGAYFNCPLLGPLNARDTVGFVVDAFTDPLSWFVPSFGDWFMIRSGEWINGVSLNIGEYEALKRAAIDPYISVRDVYFQFRENQIRH